MNATALPKLAVTAGEPAGIGPELLVKLACSDVAADLIAIIDRELLVKTAARVNLPLLIEAYGSEPVVQRRRNSIRCLSIPLHAACTPGRVEKANAEYVVETLARASDGCLTGEFDALVTAPVHKGILNDAGYVFSGHTEFFAQRAHSEVIMMLATAELRVALVTTHLPLSRVSAAISGERLTATLRILHRELQSKFAIAAPHIAVLGLNPHAGEGGHLGCEEIDIIIPALEKLRAQGMHLTGPLPADTAFVAEQRARYDAILAMYHDQGLPVLKAQGFGTAVNITLGLPYVRTSVDHGTALDLAGSGIQYAGCSAYGVVFDNPNAA